MELKIKKTSFLFRLIGSLKAFLLHLLVSVFIIFSLATFILKKWYPYPYASLAGGGYLFRITAIAAVVAGPLLTFVFFNSKKTKRELTFDLLIVLLLQSLFITYGVYILALSRPVILAYETDRFVVVTYTEINQEDISKALPSYQRFSWSGPKLVGTRDAKDTNETFESISLSMKGLEPSLRPQWWQPYEKNLLKLKKRMRKLSDLYKKSSPKEKEVILHASKKINLPIESIFYLPLISNKNLDDWIVLLDSEGTIIGYAPINGFD